MKNTVTILEGEYEKLAKKIYEIGVGFEFEVEYCDRLKGFDEISRFDWESHELTYFSNNYKGKAYINLSQYNGEPNECLKIFLYYIYDQIEEGFLDTYFLVAGKARKELKDLINDVFGKNNIKVIELSGKLNCKKKEIGFVVRNKFNEGDYINEI